MKSNKKIAIILLLVINMFIITSCEVALVGKREITTLLFVRIAGIDKGKEKENNLRLTVSSKDISPGGEAKEQSISKTISNEGITILSNQNQFNLYSDMEIYWGNNEIIVISEELAKEGIASVLDFFVRDNNQNIDMFVFISKGWTAEDIIRKGSDEKMFVGDKIKNIVKGVKYNTDASVIELLEIIKMLDNENTGLYLPVITLLKKEETNGKEEYNVKIDGYALFRKDKLIDIVSGDKAKGISFIINKVDSGDIYVKDKKNKYITLEIAKSVTNIESEIKGEEIFFNIKIKLISNIEEYNGSDDIFQKDYLEFLNNQQKEIVYKQVKEAIVMSLQHNVDFYGIGEILYHKYPNKWEKSLRSKWIEKYPHTKYTITIDSKIERTSSINKPINWR
jgi:spore germination protein KC